MIFMRKPVFGTGFFQFPFAFFMNLTVLFLLILLFPNFFGELKKRICPFILILTLYNTPVPSKAGMKSSFADSFCWT